MAAYTTSTNVAVLLNTTFDGTTDPTQTEVNDIIARVEDFIEQFTGRIWTTATTTEYFDTLDESRIAYGNPTYLPNAVQTVFFMSSRPVVSIDSLQVNYGGLTSTDWRSLATGYAEDALFYGREGYVEFHNQAPDAGRKNVKITYTYGVSGTPNDIKYAAELLAAEEVINAQSGGQQFDSVTIGNVSYSWESIEERRKSYHGKAMEILNARGFTFKPEFS